MPNSTNESLEQAVQTLKLAAPRLAKMTPDDRAKLVDKCLQGVLHVAERWVTLGCEAKQIDPFGPAAAEEISAGPLATARYLKLLARSLQEIATYGRPRLPGKAKCNSENRLVVPVFPTKSGLFDSLLFAGFSATVWMQPSTTRENIHESLASRFRNPPPAPSVCLVLGAGNVSSIAATDMLTKIFQEGRAVLLKMNPVNERLGPLFEEAFASLLREGFLRLIYGGAEIGSRAANHETIDSVHVTGSTATHGAIAWGTDSKESQRRKKENDPKLKKTITSELGNISPWIIVPGKYTKGQLAFQVENLASAIVNNASFNCVAPKMIITCRTWPQRDEFLKRLKDRLAQTPRRFAYYPGACERFQRFAPDVLPSETELLEGKHESRASEIETPLSEPPQRTTSQRTTESPAIDSKRLPWTLRENVNLEQHQRLFQEESFVCVVGEMALDAPDAEAFLDQVGPLVNEKLWGTLAATVIVPKAYRRSPQGKARFQRLLGELQYGTVCVNQWPGLAFALMSCPWGGFPGATLEDPQSGIGWVHNTYFLDAIEKTVLEGPLVVHPKPLWFIGHRSADTLARRVLDLYASPRWWKLIGIALVAIGMTRKQNDS